jgi:hypothetical protein
MVKQTLEILHQEAEQAYESGWNLLLVPSSAWLSSSKVRINA